MFNSKISKRSLFFIFSHSIFIAITSLFLYGLINTVSNDASAYNIIIDLLRGSNFFESFLTLRYEIGSLYLLWIFGNFFSSFFSVYLISLIALLIKYYLFHKYLNYPFIAYFLYLITFAHILDANQLRAALSVCILFYALFASPKSKYTYIWLSLAAVLFHYSGIIILILYFVRLPFVPLFGVFFGALFFDEVIMYFDFLSFARIWRSDPAGQVNLTNSFFIMQVFISIASTVYWKSLSEGQRRGALFNMVGVVVYLSFIENAVVAHRIRELSQLGIFPILFLGTCRLTSVKLISSVCFGYIIVYNLFLIFSELLHI